MLLSGLAVSRDLFRTASVSPMPHRLLGTLSQQLTALEAPTGTGGQADTQGPCTLRGSGIVSQALAC